MPDAGGPVREGDRLLLDPTITSLAALAWAEVEILDYVEDPTSFPWNSGPAYPYRIGFRVDVVTDDGVLHLQRLHAVTSARIAARSSLPLALRGRSSRQS